MRKVVVEAPSHLHAGNIDLTGDLGRLYGTVGFTLRWPKCVVELEQAEELLVEGPDGDKARVYASKVMNFANLRGVKVTVKEAIPRHLGLGSQTALALSIAVGLSALYGLDLSVEEAAKITGRGGISALGVYGFKLGGFIVDGGFKTAGGRRIPPLIFHCPVPEDWVFVVCIPRAPIPKVLEVKAREEEVLGSLKPMPRELSSELARLVVMKMIPAIVERDLKSFGEALTVFNRRLGGYWSNYQAGIYCDPIVEEGVDLLLSWGAACACQSCWGPTFYGILDSEDAALRAKEALEDYLKRVGGGTVFITRADNSGAKVEVRG